MEILGQFIGVIVLFSLCITFAKYINFKKYQRNNKNKIKCIVGYSCVYVITVILFSVYLKTLNAKYSFTREFLSGYYHFQNTTYQFEKKIIDIRPFNYCDYIFSSHHSSNCQYIIRSKNKTYQLINNSFYKIESV